MDRTEKIQCLKEYCSYMNCVNCVFNDIDCNFYKMTDKELNECAVKIGLTISEETVKIKYFAKDIEKLEKISVGDWIDLRASETIFLKEGEYKLIPLGVGMILPKGYEAYVLPRSSTPDKFGIVCANSIGVIDNSYNGDNDEWKFPAVALRDTTIHKGDRIAQFRINKNQPIIKFEEVDKLNDTSRGGIGSTGKR